MSPVPAGVGIHLPIPDEPESRNIAALAAKKVERFTGGTPTVLTLGNTAIEGMEQVFKNGTLLDPSNPTAAGAYFISGNTITLGTALVMADVVVVHYQYRVAR